MHTRRILCRVSGLVLTSVVQHFSQLLSGTRNVVAECMGKLALLEPNDLLPNLRDQLKSQSPLVRSTVVTAIKFTILDQVRHVACPCGSDFLWLITNRAFHFFSFSRKAILGSL